MSTEEFKVKAQELYDKYDGRAGEQGHLDIDDLLKECLISIGYGEGIDILFNMRDIWYS